MTATVVRERHLWRARADSAASAVLLAGAVAMLGAPAAGAQLQAAQPRRCRARSWCSSTPGTSGSQRANLRAAAGTQVDDALRRPGLQRVRRAQRHLGAAGHPAARGELARALRAAESRLPRDGRGADDPRYQDELGPGPDPGAAGVETTRRQPLVTVAVVDTGIADEHPDLGANVDTGRGRDFVDEGVFDGAADGPDGFDPVDDARDLDGHGTHVAGTIAAAGNNGIGVAGVSGTARSCPCASSTATATARPTSLADGLDYAGAIGAQVANVSISGRGVRPGGRAARSRSHPGTLYVVAAGNDTSDNDRRRSLRATWTRRT